MACRNNFLCLKQIGRCLAAALILAVSGCSAFQHEMDSCAVEEFAVSTPPCEMVSGPPRWYPDPECTGGYRATYWYPWCENCIECGQIACEHDASVPLISDTEQIPTPVGELMHREPVQRPAQRPAQEPVQRPAHEPKREARKDPLVHRLPSPPPVGLQKSDDKKSKPDSGVPLTDHSLIDRLFVPLTGKPLSGKDDSAFVPPVLENELRGPAVLQETRAGGFSASTVASQNITPRRSANQQQLRGRPILLNIGLRRSANWSW